ncbi:aspartic proteinase CDR1-like [Nicotiana tabacum]|uniref:Aspartic proteinase CDR1-like n=1 Tax=Nicotiana tabacum TaxID=4097 RepID=A0AC58SS91_TOBAC|nr:aspartic proteinase CDR1-like [Nicotiana tomentosiformis]XP_016497423.1 PREDICTED: aspartic proteinase CDR1-like [Nicotiana tabacum]
MALKITSNLFSSTLLIITFSFLISLITNLIYSSLRVDGAKTCTIGRGFSIDLIHPSSKLSPLVNHVASADLIPDAFGGSYLLNFSVGTPPQFQLAVADTGSGFIWIQCQPCQCYNQKFPIYAPTNSSTYEEQPCHSPKCSEFAHCEGGICTYYVDYVDKSSSSGEVATETLSLYSSSGEKISFPNILFGCGRNSRSTSRDPGLSGIVGLGFSSFSLVSQIASTFDQRFSFCFVPLAKLDVPSKLSFGDKVDVSGPGTHVTPLLVKPSRPSYYLTLIGLSIGNIRLELLNNSSTTFQVGNIIIDSGTTFTFLPTWLYNQLILVVRQAIHVEPVVDGGSSSTVLCYRALNSTDVPPITMHLLGADLPLSVENIMHPDPQGYQCLAFRPTENEAFFGSVTQTNFLVAYDLENMSVSFKATDCTNMA